MCQVCGAAPSRIVYGGEPPWDRCFDRRMAAQTGVGDLGLPAEDDAASGTD
jgi:hypothetical protein